MNKKSFLSMMAMVMMAFVVCIGFAACGDDDENVGGGSSSSSIPSGLIGTWYKTSGTGVSNKWSIRITFNADGTGTGQASHNNIVSIHTWVFTYQYKSNGDVVVDATETSVDEEETNTFKRKMTFHYNGKTLTGIDSGNGNWEGCTFEK